jgi:hypothetical protein
LRWNLLWDARLLGRLHNHIWSSSRRNGISVELWRLVMLLDLLALLVDIHLVLELCAIGLQVGRAASACTEVELNIEAAHTDRPVTLWAEMELVLNLAPGFLQGISLLLVPFGTVNLFTGLSSASPESTK